MPLTQGEIIKYVVQLLVVISLFFALKYYLDDIKKDTKHLKYIKKFKQPRHVEDAPDNTEDINSYVDPMEANQIQQQEYDRRDHMKRHRGMRKKKKDDRYDDDDDDIDNDDGGNDDDLYEERNTRGGEGTRRRGKKKYNENNIMMRDIADVNEDSDD